MTQCGLCALNVLWGGIFAWCFTGLEVLRTEKYLSQLRGFKMAEAQPLIQLPGGRRNQCRLCPDTSFEQLSVSKFLTQSKIKENLVFHQILVQL